MVNCTQSHSLKQDGKQMINNGDKNTGNKGYIMPSTNTCRCAR